MLKRGLHIILFVMISQLILAQESPVMSFELPFRNSLKFNTYTINPTFSFVRSQSRFVTFSNKRELVQFDDAPQTYLFSYSGRLRENMGFAVGVYQQNYGVLTSFGGVINYAYNVTINGTDNLTFGTNIGVYQSGINDGNVITNNPEPLLGNFDSSMLVTFNPGINYGSTFLDVGVSLKNFTLYDVSNSSLIKEDPQRSIQAHLMYTGYMQSRGFFDNARFRGLVQSEFKRDHTEVSGLMMLTVPKGIWAQVGYNTVYGVSGGLGVNLSQSIALEYNYETSIGDVVSFGPSHEVTVAFKLKNKQRHHYSEEDKLGSLIPEARRPITRYGQTRTRTKVSETKVQPQPVKETVVAKEATVAETKKEETPLKTVKDEVPEKATVTEAKETVQDIKRTPVSVVKDTIAAIEVAPINVAKTEDIATKKIEVPQPKVNESAIREMEEATNAAKATGERQEKLLQQLTQRIAIKAQDLKDLKEENDLGDQGIFVAPKPFKSIAAENAALETLKLDIDQLIVAQDQKIKELEDLYNERVKNASGEEDEIATIYLDEILLLKKLQSDTKRSRLNLVSELDSIGKAMEFERKRRIKRATFDNQEDRYNKDLEALSNIKQSTEVVGNVMNVEDFDFGVGQGGNVKIVKDVPYIEEGYYVVLAVHNNINKRDEFLKKAVASGQADINFFFDVNTNSYYIYHEKFNSLEAAGNAVQDDEGKPYKQQMSIIKIEK